ncbi:hypothetical protein IG193_00435 [Infirmifilum lucidum]|uniref:Uncharacterized protein n=1 Tax=Infirmifilum lucidum TaxID=2776706 RepID=A0A7L9FGL6_9CREN|nr:hypothetical protein [Infirmifilum lucidum]QOJ78968.1 hypothetical protein IG193_00435 [Infirmifilum lucidum]
MDLISGGYTTHSGKACTGRKAPAGRVAGETRPAPRVLLVSWGLIAAARDFQELARPVYSQH